MTIRAPFQPKRGANQVLTPTSSSDSVAIDPVAKSVRLVNSGATNICHVRIGQGKQIATTADMPILPGESIIVSKGDGDDNIGHISDSGTTLHVQTGEGGI